MPYAYYHDDAPDFLSTPDDLFAYGDLKLHSKKTFLVPGVFTIPFLLPFPALITIPLFQHGLGMLLILQVGLLCRLWFRSWRVFILPLTLLAAANPFYLWYEQTIMAETIFVFCTALLAIAGTLYTLARTHSRFLFLCIALVLEAGARPEGKLLFGFALLLVLLLHGRSWKTGWKRPAIVLALAIALHFATKTSQAGLLLYTSVARLTPTNLKCAPGFDPYIAPLRADLQNRWKNRPSFPKVKDRRVVSEVVERYLKDHPTMITGRKGRQSTHAFCLRLAKETCLRNLSYLPVHVYHKFRSAATESPSGQLTNAWLFDKQRTTYLGSFDRTQRLSKGLTGQKMTTEADVNSFLEKNYHEIGWFETLTNRWLATVNAWRFPDATYQEDSIQYVYPGVPWYFVIAVIGLIVVALRPGPLRPFHIAWGLTLLGFFFVVMLTANVRPRFRIVFEPFWFLYIGLLLESIAQLFLRWFPRR